MPDIDSTTAGQKPRSNAWRTAVTMVQEAEPPFIPVGAHAMTIVVEFPPGDPGTPGAAAGPGGAVLNTVWDTARAKHGWWSHDGRCCRARAARSGQAARGP